MKATTIIVCRILLGAIFAFAGINGLLLLVGVEPVGPTSLHVPWMQVLVNTHFVFIPLKSLELIAGILLLLNRFVPLALLALLPIGVNIFLLHLFADQALLINGIVVLLLLAVLLSHYRGYYSGLFVAKAA